MPPPLLSLSLATYNRWHELEPVMRALMPQLGNDVELIISDNASPDGTAEKAEALAGGDPGIRILRHAQNVGAILNFRDAMEAASGGHVMLLADDDVPTPGFLAFVRSVLRDRPGYGVYHFVPASTPAPLRVETAPAGARAIALIFAHSGMIPGITFPRQSYRRDLWPHDQGIIYPQVFLASMLAREQGAVLAESPDCLLLGGLTDTALNRMRNRPTDYGVGERMRHIAETAAQLPDAERLPLMNRAVNDMLTFAWTVFDELEAESPPAADRFLNALLEVWSVRTSPLLPITWKRHAHRNRTFARRTRRRIVQTTLHGMTRIEFWRLVAAWLSERRALQA